MRGEETQAAGLLQRGDVSVPATLVVLSSHTKFIPINEKGEILGSLTTLSGQVYEAILAETFVGKSVEKRDNADEKPEGYFDEAIVKNAIEWIGRVGIVRSLMFPRFLDVLLDTKWYERQLFFEALIAAEDMAVLMWRIGEVNLSDRYDESSSEISAKRALTLTASQIVASCAALREVIGMTPTRFQPVMEDFWKTMRH